MNDAVQAYIARRPDGIQALYARLREAIFRSISGEIEERLWAKLPGYYAGEAFVRLIPFRDHINIEASGAQSHRAELADWRWTPKGMLQVYPERVPPMEVLERIFWETLCGEGGECR